MIVWAFVAHAIGIDETVVDGVSRLDAAIILLAILAVCGLVIKVVRDAQRIAADENEQGS
jgi:hypothetical protein